MDLLQEARNIINDVDAQMAELFVQRMRAAEMVAAYKKAHDLPRLDAKREEAVIDNGSQRVRDEALRPYYIDFMRHTMALSRQYQQQLLRCAEDASAQEIPIELGKHSYTVTIAPGALTRSDSYFHLKRKVLIVTDSGVPAQYAQTVAGCCSEPVVVTVPQGEKSKSSANYDMLCRTMLHHGFTRTDCVVAVGGGMVGDLAGFAATSFLRGIDFYNIPTTLLAQVDASVGGKVAIDLDGIKNCIGAFYQPKAVLIDSQLLHTLSKRQMANGLAEAVKMAITFDAQLLSLLESEDYLSHIDRIIASCVRIKAAVVQADEKEAGLRRVLNFGHTIGHGIETAVGLGLLYHGECVALGMLPMCAQPLRARVEAIFKRLHLPTRCTGDPEAVWQAICHDKKRSGDTITVVYAPQAGSYALRDMPIAQLKQIVYSYLTEKES